MDDMQVWQGAPPRRDTLRPPQWGLVWATGQGRAQTSLARWRMGSERRCQHGLERTGYTGRRAAAGGPAAAARKSEAPTAPLPWAPAAGHASLASTLHGKSPMRRHPLPRRPIPPPPPTLPFARPTPQGGPSAVAAGGGARRVCIRVDAVAEAPQFRVGGSVPVRHLVVQVQLGVHHHADAGLQGRPVL